MRGLFRRQRPTFNCPKFYLLIRFWWVQKMDRLVGGLSKSQLWFSLIVFTILGTSLCVFTVLRGFMAFSPQRMRIDAVTVVKPVYKDYDTGPLHLDISRKNDEQQSNLSKYIDSVLNISVSVDLLHIEHSKGKEIWKRTITGENKTANDKK